MVCQENVVSWFRGLTGYKRVDVMCTLLNMCLPFEIRYLGTYIEDIGKRDYNELRDTEHRANTIGDLNDLGILGLTDTKTRRKFVLYMALLHSNNYPCALVHYQNLSNFDPQLIASLLSSTVNYSQEENFLDELLLLYTMALNHPAFTYEQKTTFGNIYMKLQEDEEARLNLTKPIINSTNLTTEQFCGPCIIPGEQIIDGASRECTLPSPSMQFYSVNPINSWPMYRRDLLTYTDSPQASRQESPLESRSPSRSNSPSTRRNKNTGPKLPFDNRINAPVNQAATLTTLASTCSTTCSSSSSSSNHKNQIPSANPSSGCSSTQTNITVNKNVSSQSRTGSRETVNSPYTKQNNFEVIPSGSVPNKTLYPSTVPTSLTSDRTSTNIQQQPPPRFKQEPVNPKENTFTVNEYGQINDEELRDIGQLPNVVGQLRNIIKSQATTNGQLMSDNNLVYQTNTESPPEFDNLQSIAGVSSDNNWTTKTSTIHNSRQPIAAHHGHGSIGSLRRCYPTMPSTDPTLIRMHAPPPNVTTRTPCCVCLNKSMGGINTRCSRYNPQHMFCLTQLQSLQLDPDSGQHCSQSSSSDSSESRSPSETPPAAPWSTNNTSVTTTITSTTSSQITSNDANKVNPCDNELSSVNNPGTLENNASSIIPSSRLPQINLVQQNFIHNNQAMRERPRNTKKYSNMKRQKNQMINGRPNLSQCVPAFPITGPPIHSQMNFRPPGQFPLPNIYSTFPHTVYRPNYPANYQLNGEMIYSYPGQSVTGGTPTSPAMSVVNIPPTSQAYMPASVVTFAHIVQQPNISCHNCGSNTHLAVDCTDQTVEDLTKKVQYRLDYSTMNQPRDCSSNDK